MPIKYHNWSDHYHHNRKYFNFRQLLSFLALVKLIVWNINRPSLYVILYASRPISIKAALQFDLFWNEELDPSAPCISPKNVLTCAPRLMSTMPASILVSVQDSFGRHFDCSSVWTSLTLQSSVHPGCKVFSDCVQPFFSSAEAASLPAASGLVKLTRASHDICY